MDKEKYNKLVRRIEELNTVNSSFDSTYKSKGEKCSLCGKRDKYSELTSRCIFHCEKNDWYSLNDKKEKIWSRDKIDEFWHQIQNDFNPNNNANYNYFIFPKFSDTSFWLKNEEKVYENGAVFMWCKFLDDAKFFKIKFKGNLLFYFCEINGITDFRYSKFEGITDFKDNRLKGKTYFTQSSFREDGRFGKNFFKQEVLFSNCHFSKNLEFQGSVFSNNAELSLIHCAGYADFMSTIFKKESTFWLSQFKRADFQGAKFSKNDQTLFQETNFGQTNFTNIIFSHNVIFRRTNLERVKFQDSKIDTAQFTECHFDESLKRKALYDEILIHKRKKSEEKRIKENNNKTSSIKFLEKIRSYQISSKDYEEVEELNRQLKKNYENKKDYETAGDFHIGEMEMRRKKFIAELNEKNIGKNWFTKIFSFMYQNSARRFLLFWYRLFSKYGEKPGTVIISILVSWLLFFFLFWKSNNLENTKIFKSIGMTIENFVPFLPKVNIEKITIFQRIVFDIEIFISSILWFLLIISVRRKFKR